MIWGRRLIIVSGEEGAGKSTIVRALLPSTPQGARIDAEEYAAVLRPLTATVASGNGARPNSDVLEVTGTAPVTFAEFAARTAPAWK